MGPFHALDSHGALCFTSVIKRDLTSVLAIGAVRPRFPYFTFPHWVCSDCPDCVKATFFPLPEVFTTLSAVNWETKELLAKGCHTNKERRIISNSMTA